MDNLIPFDYHGKEVRTVTLDGEPWFIAKDVCGILDIINPSDAVKRLDEDERSSFNLGRRRVYLSRKRRNKMLRRYM